MEFCQKPSRSDVRLSREEELETEAKTREFLNALNPLRHCKPSRSEYSSLYVDSCKSKDPIPQLAEFQRVEKDSMPKIYYDGCEVPEEFVETEYYEDLNCIDKQHHTVGLVSTLLHILPTPMLLAGATLQPIIGVLLLPMIREVLLLPVESPKGVTINEKD